MTPHRPAFVRLALCGVNSVLYVALSLSLASCDGKPNGETAPTPLVDVQSTAPISSCNWKDIKPVMVSIDSIAAEGVCHTMQVTLGRLPSIALAHKLFQLIFIIRVGDGGQGPSPKVLAQQVMDVVEVRGLQNNDDGIDETFETLAKIYNGSDGRVTPRDVNIALRASGPLAKTMNQEALFTMAAIIESEKKDAGE